MVRQLSLILSGLLLLSTSQAKSDARMLTPHEALGKIRERLMGDWPTREEWSELTSEMKSTGCREVTCLKSFFGKKIRQYQSTNQYVGRMALKIDELFYIRSAVHPWSVIRESKDDYLNRRYEIDGLNSLSNLGRKIFADNLPWDQLYLAKSFEIYPSISNHGSRSEAQFYGTETERRYEYMTNNGKDLPEMVRVDLQNNPNAAGAFSTPKFTDRFWNSSLNQGRKRSAAVFRIMICDTLFPSLERKSAAAEEDTKATGISEQALAQLHSAGVVNKHATDPACIRCHERLDPLAWTMRGLERSLSSRPFPGLVRFYDESGKLTKFKAESFSDAIATFTKQNRYRACQVDRLFKWVIGGDVDLTKERTMTLENDFDRLDRRTNDFISHLLLQPEFLTKPRKKIHYSVEGSLYEKATAVFGHCVECHGTSLPFNDLKKWDKSRLEKIAYKLDLENNGLSRQMPPAGYTKWQPSKEEILTVKDWISAGAVGADGVRTLSDAEARSVLGSK